MDRRAGSLVVTVAAVVSGPLGLVGALARRPGRRGTAARLVVPLGAVLGPFVTGRSTAFEHEPWLQRVADLVTGSVLPAAGALGVLRVAARREPAPPGAAPC